MARGGKRQGAGRPRSNSEESKAFWLEKSIGEKAKSGYYEALEKLLEDWMYRQADNGTTTRDWTQCNELLSEFNQLKTQYKHHSQ